MSDVAPWNGSRERGFTLVEVLVVMMIIAVVTSFGVMSLRSSRDTGGRLEVKAAAMRYADAVERFQAEHGRTPPRLGTADWPAGALASGPVKRLEIGAGAPVIRPYLRGTPPELMQRTGATGGRITAQAPAPGARGGHIVYTARAHSFRIDVFWNGTPVCSLGDVPAGTRTC